MAVEAVEAVEAAEGGKLHQSPLGDPNLAVEAANSIPNTNTSGEGDLPDPHTAREGNLPELYTNPNLGNPPDKLARAGESR